MFKNTVNFIKNKLKNSILLNSKNGTKKQKCTHSYLANINITIDNFNATNFLIF